MGEQRELVGSVKGHYPGQRPATGKEGAEPMIGEDSGHEILAEVRVPKAPLFLDGQEGIRRDQGVAKKPRPSRRGVPPRSACGYTRTRSIPQLGESFFST